MNLVNNVVVTNLKSSNQIKITWDASADSSVTAYRIYRGVSPYHVSTLVTTVSVPTVMYTDTPTLIPINEYYYKVAEYDGSSEGPLPTYGVTCIDYDAWTNSPFTDQSPHTYPSNDSMLFYLEEIRRRNLWLLEQNGEPMTLMKKRYEGTRCSHIDTTTGEEQCPYPLKAPACYGTGFVGGYYSAISIKVRRASTSRTVGINEVGFRVGMKPRMWTIWSPSVDVGDFLVDQMNRRFEVVSKEVGSARGLDFHQDFEVNLASPRDMIMKVPIV